MVWRGLVLSISPHSLSSFLIESECVVHGHVDSRMPITWITRCSIGIAAGTGRNLSYLNYLAKYVSEYISYLNTYLNAYMNVVKLGLR